MYITKSKIKSTAKRQPFTAHILEMRQRLLCIIAAFFFYLVLVSTVGTSIDRPFKIDPLNSLSTGAFRIASTTVLPEKVTIIQIGLMDSLAAMLMGALVVSIILTLPVASYHILSFASPGLTRKENRVLSFVVFIVFLLFLAGMAVSLIVVCRLIFKFLFIFNDALRINTTIGVYEFSFFVLFMMLISGIVFQLPVLMAILARYTDISLKTMAKPWKSVVILTLIIGAVVTPDGTGISQIIVAIFLLILYTIGLLAAVLSKKFRKNQGILYRD